MSGPARGWRAWAVFTAAGLAYALMVEFEHKAFAMALTAQQAGPILGAAVAFYVAALQLFYFLHRRVDRWIARPALASLFYLAVTGGFGLFVLEWVIVGNTPAGNPNASQVLMLAFHGAYPFMARITADGRPFALVIRRRAAWYFLAATALTLLGLLLPAGFPRFAWFIWAPMAVYVGLYIFIWQYVRRAPAG